LGSNLVTKRAHELPWIPTWRSDSDLEDLLASFNSIARTNKTYKVIGLQSTELAQHSLLEPPPAKTAKKRKLPDPKHPNAGPKRSQRKKARFDPPAYEYCICGVDQDQAMVGCDNASCKRQWFHWTCVGLLSEPSQADNWMCVRISNPCHFVDDRLCSMCSQHA
jgi:hypothetical protein